MLIVSKFHDYYDTAMAFGIDKTCIYLRKTEEIEMGSIRRSGLTCSSSVKKKIKFVFNRHIIGFCGKLYPVVQCSLYGEPDDAGKRKLLNILNFYEDWELIQFVKGMGLDHPSRSYRSWLYDLGYDHRDEKTIKKFFDVQRWQHLEKNFAKYKCPVFMTDYHGHKDFLVLNPMLKPYRFARMKDPFAAFQEIYMYISGVLGNTEKEMIQISNEDMRDKKGFDKWSFKTMPGTKKRRKK